MQRNAHLWDTVHIAPAILRLNRQVTFVSPHEQGSVVAPVGTSTGSVSAPPALGGQNGSDFVDSNAAMSP
ncbi:unnamed protein product, partial [Ectocarpus sp. 12 AP-2014]